MNHEHFSMPENNGDKSHKRNGKSKRKNEHENTISFRWV